MSYTPFSFAPNPDYWKPTGNPRGTGDNGRQLNWVMECPTIDDLLLPIKVCTDGNGPAHFERWLRYRKDLYSQDDLQFDHGDIMGDPYSRSMFEAQQDSAA